METNAAWLSTTVRRIPVIAALMFFIGAIPSALAATSTCTNATTSPGVFYVGTTGAGGYTQTLNGTLYTEGQIGVMADRILLTQVQIGQMADRIVYVTQMSETNSILAIYVLSGLTYLGMNDGGYSYSATLTQVPSLPAGW